MTTCLMEIIQGDHIRRCERNPSRVGYESFCAQTGRRNHCEVQRFEVPLGVGHALGLWIGVDDLESEVEWAARLEFLSFVDTVDEVQKRCLRRTQNRTLG